MAYTFRGIGAMHYGKRDFRPDGSYVTTLWFVVFYVPLVPIHSKRLGPTGEVKYFSTRRVPVQAVTEKMRPNRTQVLSVYGWFAAELAFGITAELRHSLWIAVPGVLLLPLPWMLRRRAMDRMKADLERKQMGFSSAISE